jgi:hypothetical protein
MLLSIKFRLFVAESIVNAIAHKDYGTLIPIPASRRGLSDGGANVDEKPGM